MISYIVEFSILHLLFFGIYKLLLSKETQLSFLRFFLVGSTALSLVLPLIEIPTKVNIPTFDTTTFLPMVTVGNTESFDVPWYLILVVVISVIFTFKLILNLIQIYGWYQQSETDSLEEIEIRKVSGLQNSFTFFQWIFIDPKNFENPADIIRHEHGHAKNLHSLDLIFFYTLTIFAWWLPSVWLMIKELKAVHEFEADDYALKISDKTYTKTLVQCTLKAHGMDLASSFDDAPIFNRLNFIKKMKKKISIWKVASVAALVAISGAMFACEEEIESEIEDIISESNQKVEYTGDVKTALQKLEQQNPGQKYAVIETVIENEESIQKLIDYDSDQVEQMFVTTEDGKKSVVMIVNQSSDLFNKTVELQKSNADEAYAIVEEPASFPGGATELANYLGKNLKYPQQAQDLGVEGKVYVQFIVEEDGSLSNFEILKGIGAGCDAEAIRVMAESPKWNPGTQDGKKIRQKMVQGLIFKLPS